MFWYSRDLFFLETIIMCEDEKSIGEVLAELVEILLEIEEEHQLLWKAEEDKD